MDIFGSSHVIEYLEDRLTKKTSDGSFNVSLTTSGSSEKKDVLTKVEEPC